MAYVLVVAAYKGDQEVLDIAETVDVALGAGVDSHSF